MTNINIPKIYVENIIGVTFNRDVQFKYYYKEKLTTLIFGNVYFFDYCEWEYINDINWINGLVEYKQSELLDDMFSRINPVLFQNSFGGEPEKIRHYKLAIDDEGIYNIVCKDFQIDDK